MREGYNLKTLGHRAAQLIVELNERRQPIFSLADVTEITGLSPSSARSLVANTEARGIVTHYVIGGSAPEMAGTEQPRRFELAGDRLVLQADRGDWTAHVVWERHNPA